MSETVNDRQLDREVALKVLPRNLVHDAGFVERFQREARIAAQLELSVLDNRGRERKRFQDVLVRSN